MKIFVQKILGKMARAVLWRRTPFVIGITGSIGKTTTKDALYTIFVPHVNVRTNIANYNNEFGVPLTVIGAVSGKRSIIGWARVVLVWLWAMTVQRDYPKVLILELGIDCRGDMDYLIDMVAPQMGIVTTIFGVHAQKLGSVATIAKEKGRLIRRLPSGGDAILNADDSRVAKMRSSTKANVVLYSAEGNHDATIYATEVSGGGHGGLTFKINEGQVSVPVRLPKIIGLQMVPSVVAAIAAARTYGLNLVDIAQALVQFTPPKRRMNVITTHDGTTIIDDTYNAAPASVRGALTALRQFPLSRSEARRVAVLGDMYELGDSEEKEHRALVQHILAQEIDAVVCVGSLMKHLYDALVDACEEEYQVVAPYHYPDTGVAAEAIAQIVSPGDTVLCKGSNGMRMWKIVEKLTERK